VAVKYIVFGDLCQFTLCTHGQTDTAATFHTVRVGTSQACFQNDICSISSTYVNVYFNNQLFIVASIHTSITSWTDRHSGYFSYTFCSVSKPQTFRVTMYRDTDLPLTFAVLYPHSAVFVCLGYVIVRLMIAVSETRTSSSEYGRDRKDT